MKPFVAYYRVSTDRQGRSGLGLEAQRAAVAHYAAGRGELLAEFTEIESGKRSDNRPELVAALAACRQRRAVLVIARLDRLARNVAFIANLMDSSAEFVAVDMPEANRLTLHILAAVAEHEREMISQRTRAALAAARARGTRLGNPRAAEAAPLAHQACRQKAAAFAGAILPLLEQMRRDGGTLRGIAAELNQRGIKASRGGLWHPQTVQSVLARAG